MIRSVIGLVVALVGVLPAKAAPITVPQDIVFLMDSSGSLTPAEFADGQQFLSNLISGLSPQLTRSGLINFSTTVQTTATLVQSQSTVLSALANLTQIGGETNTSGAIQAGISQFNTLSNLTNPKLMVLLTDGVPNRSSGPSGNPIGDVCQTQGTLTSMGIQTLIVGVGGLFNASALSCILQSSNDMYLVPNFASANLLLQNQAFQSYFTQGYVIPENTAAPSPDALVLTIFGLLGLIGLRRLAPIPGAITVTRLR